jgi:hypothetical protein
MSKLQPFKPATPHETKSYDMKYSKIIAANTHRSPCRQPFDRSLKFMKNKTKK